MKQDLGDMNLIVTALKQKLAPFGWTEAVRREHKAPGYAVSAVSCPPPSPACACFGPGCMRLRA